MSRSAGPGSATRIHLPAITPSEMSAGVVPRFQFRTEHFVGPDHGYPGEYQTELRSGHRFRPNAGRLQHDLQKFVDDGTKLTASAAKRIVEAAKSELDGTNLEISVFGQQIGAFLNEFADRVEPDGQQMLVEAFGAEVEKALAQRFVGLHHLHVMTADGVITDDEVDAFEKDKKSHVQPELIAPLVTNQGLKFEGNALVRLRAMTGRNAGGLELQMLVTKHLRKSPKVADVQAVIDAVTRVVADDVKGNYGTVTREGVVARLEGALAAAGLPSADQLPLPAAARKRLDAFVDGSEAIHDAIGALAKAPSDDNAVELARAIKWRVPIPQRLREMNRDFLVQRDQRLEYARQLGVLLGDDYAYAPDIGDAGKFELDLAVYGTKTAEARRALRSPDLLGLIRQTQGVCLAGQELRLPHPADPKSQVVIAARSNNAQYNSVHLEVSAYGEEKMAFDAAKDPPITFITGREQRPASDEEVGRLLADSDLTELVRRFLIDSASTL